jgi:hypothetical protein
VKTIPLSCALLYGEVAEWPKATVLKTVGGRPPVGSNPTLSAKFLIEPISYNPSFYSLFVSTVSSISLRP